MQDKSRLQCKNCSRALILSILALLVAIFSTGVSFYIRIQMSELRNQIQTQLATLKDANAVRSTSDLKPKDGMDELITTLSTLQRAKRHLHQSSQRFALIQSILQYLESLKFVDTDEAKPGSYCNRTLVCKGKPGRRGKAGPRGQNGDKGDQGDNGPRGRQGLQGRPGQKGEKGERGLRGPPGLSIEKAKITNKPTDVIANKGSVVTFTCEANGYPKPDIEWILNNKSITTSNKKYKLIEDVGLEIDGVSESDHGNVTCIAKNIMGQDHAKAKLSVLVKPMVRTSPTQISAIGGRRYEVNCTGSGYPKPKLQWKRLRGVLPVSAHVKSDGRLVFTDINKDDGGYYICIGENSAGKAEASTIIAVQDPKPVDCKDLLMLGNRRNGVYTMWSDDGNSFQVYCDMTTDGGGWTVFQRRVDESTDFYRGWNEYKRGFGDLNGNFWLGLDKISELTAKPSSLRIELGDLNDLKGYAKYSRFKVGNEETKYQLEVGGFSGTAKDSLKYHNHMQFTTKDKDNDKHGKNLNCALLYKGAWWYNSCLLSNLNGLHPKKKGNPAQIMSWYMWKNVHDTIKFSEMKLRRLI